MIIMFRAAQGTPIGIDGYQQPIAYSHESCANGTAEDAEKGHFIEFVDSKRSKAAHRIFSEHVPH